MARFRRLTVRYEWREDIHLAFATLAAALICLDRVRQLCQALSATCGSL